MGITFISAIVLQWVYFGIKHKKRVGTFGVVVENVEEETKEVEENPYGRPKLFWIDSSYSLYSWSVLVYSVASISGIYGSNGRNGNDQLSKEFW